MLEHENKVTNMLSETNARLNLALAAGASFEITASMHTDVGCVREVNEDNGRHFKPNDPEVLADKGLLTLVADGMGGHASGEVASAMAVELVGRIYYQNGGAHPAQALPQAVAEASRLIYEAAQRDERWRGMGTTCTALVLHQGSAYAAHVGDSRLYMIRGGDIYLMTEDHSAVMEMVRLGVISREEARHHADKNVILRALGTAPEVQVAGWEAPLPVQDGDQFLLCSDGLYDLVEDAEIGRIVAGATDAHEACEQLIALAKERGGHDNITVGIVEARLPTGDTNTGGRRTTRDLEAAQ